MTWLHQTVNDYPGIILHDCRVSHMGIEGDKLLFQFADGFWILPGHPDNPHGKILRTGPSQLVFSGWDPSAASAHTFRDIPVPKNASIRQELPFPDFCSRTNRGLWEFEIVDEHYGAVSALFSGYLHREKKPYHIECQLSLYYKELLYHWNEICTDREW